MSIEWLRPWALVLLLALPWLTAQASSPWRRHIAPRLWLHYVGVQHARHRVRASLALMILALSGPAIDTDRVQDTAPPPLVVIIAGQWQMAANDLPPSRWQVMQQQLMALAPTLTDRDLSVLVGGAIPHLLVPPTRDGAVAAHLMGAAALDSIPGTERDLAAALRAIPDLLAEPSPPPQIWLLATTLSDAQIAACAQARHELQSRWPQLPDLTVIGVGRAGQPVSALPPRPDFGAQPPAADATLDVTALTTLAAVLDGTFVRGQDRTLSALLSHARVSPESTHQTDIGPWLVLLALPLLLWQRQQQLWCVLALLVTAALLGLTAPTPAQAADDAAAQRAMTQGEFEYAARLFSDPRWQGVAYYRAGLYRDAAIRFAQDPTAEGHYNRGNALALTGDLAAALAAYDAALALRPDWHEAQTNRTRVQQALDEQRPSTPHTDLQPPPVDLPPVAAPAIQSPLPADTTSATGSPPPPGSSTPPAPDADTPPVLGDPAALLRQQWQTEYRHHQG